jgi:hypothetical protein
MGVSLSTWNILAATALQGDAGGVDVAAGDTAAAAIASGTHVEAIVNRIGLEACDQRTTARYAQTYTDSRDGNRPE